MMKALCRVLRPNDRLIYREIRLESLRVNPESFGAKYETEVNTPELRFEKFIMQQRADAIMLGAFVEEKLVGLCGLIATPPEPVKIVQMYVKSDYRGQGIAGQLLLTAKQQILPLNSHSLTLSVYKDNHKALQAYKKAGFIPVDVKDGEIFMLFTLQ